MIRLIAAGLALLGLAAACGGNTEEAAPPATTAPYTGAADAPAAKPFPAPVHGEPKQTKVLVTVVDGDTHRRVKGARVVIGKRAGYANTRGLASVKIKRRAALPVRVSKPGYGQKVVRMPFKRKREVTVRLYRDASAVDDVRRQQPAHAGARRTSRCGRRSRSSGRAGSARSSSSPPSSPTASPTSPTTRATSTRCG